jgi:hypothetical protein
MTEEERRKKFRELCDRIVDNTITEEEAIEEYMKLGDCREFATKVYREIRGDAITASCCGCIEWPECDR